MSKQRKTRKTKLSEAPLHKVQEKTIPKETLQVLSTVGERKREEKLMKQTLWSGREGK